MGCIGLCGGVSGCIGLCGGVLGCMGVAEWFPKKRLVYQIYSTEEIILET